MKKLTCHCGEVEAEINVPDNLEKVLKCNCSICKRKGAIMSMLNFIQKLRNTIFVRTVEFTHIIIQEPIQL